MRFEFATAGRIIFGPGAVKEAASAAKELGKRALVVTGRSGVRAASLLGDLDTAGVACSTFEVGSEPTIDLVRRGTSQARAEQCDLVIAIGGGSVIDAAKTIACLLTNGGDPLDYIEVIGAGRPLSLPAVPIIAVPTTAGTGSEVTRNAVITSPEHKLKASLRSAGMLPRIAIVDPDLTLDMPPKLTASTGLDALTQLIEPYVSLRANPMTDAISTEGIRRIRTALPCAFRNGQDREARSGMSIASLFGGLALANAGLGAVHGFASPVGGMFDAPHGAVCAAMLPHVIRVNVRALRVRMPESDGLRRYESVARLLTGKPDASPEDGAAWIAGLCTDLEVPPLRAYGVRDEDIPGLVAKGAKANSMKANPILLTEEELKEILALAL
ncbi:MAG: iron-containing alcohol dehydrogenase [Bryobacteraceae bacterium]